MEAGVSSTGKNLSLTSVFEGVGAFTKGTINQQQLLELETSACPTCGSCSGMFTANSMNCLMEVLGMTVPGNGTIVATSEQRHELIRQAARHLMELVKNDIRPRDIMTREAFDNAFALVDASPAE